MKIQKKTEDLKKREKNENKLWSQKSCKTPFVLVKIKKENVFVHKKKPKNVLFFLI